MYGANAENEKLEIWMENSVVGQKVHTADGSGRAYQEVVSSFCWTENTYIFTLTSSYSLLVGFHRRKASGWAESSYFYVLVEGVEYLRGTLSGLPRKELTLYRTNRPER